MDLERALQNTIKTGKVKIGTKQTIKAAKNGAPKLVIIARNCPPDVRKQIEATKIPVYDYSGQSIDLGAACGLPYTIAAMAIIEPGESEILSLLRGA